MMERYGQHRAKKRPCLVVGSINPVVEESIKRGMPNSHTAPTVKVAPYYGVDRDGTRAGYKPEFVERVRHYDYPQYVWDKLPITGPDESLLRLDHIQPIGTHHNSYELSDYKLSTDTLGIIDELIHFVIWGEVPKDGMIVMYQESIKSTFDS